MCAHWRWRACAWTLRVCRIRSRERGPFGRVRLIVCVWSARSRARSQRRPACGQTILRCVWVPHTCAHRVDTRGATIDVLRYRVCTYATTGARTYTSSAVFIPCCESDARKLPLRPRLERDFPWKRAEDRDLSPQGELFVVCPPSTKRVPWRTRPIAPRKRPRE